MASHNYLLSYSSHYALMSKKRKPLTAVIVNCKATNPSSTAVTVTSPESPLRWSANYQPNKWDYNSIKSLDSDYVHVITVEQFGLLSSCGENKLVARLEVIDDVERLGLGHHFEEEIMRALTSIAAKNDHISVVMKEDLHAMALFFRLLRRHKLHVSQEGSFRVSLQKDVQGLLSLYEDSFLGFDGEKTLEEARDFHH
ncbi:putative myrcene synthase [Dioscorea sansibarensis]